MGDIGLGWMVRQEGIRRCRTLPRIEARRRWQQAQADLAIVRTLRSAGNHARPISKSTDRKKALKAVLFARGVRVVLGHSVRELVRQCAVHDATFAGVVESAALLNQFYIATRYPTGIPMDCLPQPCRVRRLRTPRHTLHRMSPNRSWPW